MTATIKHATITGAAANPDVLVDGPAWDASHTITGIFDAAQMPALTGDVTSSAGAVATTLATVNSNIGTFGSATQSVQFTANGKGLLTAAANVTITPAIGSVTGLGTGIAAFLATPSSANLRTALTDEVGTGATYFVGGALGTPASGTLTSCTGLPLSTGISGTGTGVLTALAVNVGTAGSVVVNGGVLGTPSSGTLTSCTGLPVTTGISGTGANIPAFLASATSANLAAAVTDETGSGSLVFATTPTITTPYIVGATPTSATVTITNASPGVVTWTSHGLAVNTPVFFSTSGALPTGLTAAVVSGAGTFSANTYTANPTLYYIKTVVDANNFTVAATLGGTAVNTSSAGSGTHTAFANAMAPAGYVDEYIYNVITIPNAFSLTTASAGQVWNTISLTAGIWEVGGNTGVIKLAASTPTVTHMHCGIVYGFTTIPTTPFNGAVAMHVTSNDPNGWMIANNPEKIFLTTTTTINGVITADFTGGTLGAYGKLWAKRLAR